MIGSTHRRYQRRGISLITVVVSMPLMLGVAALVVDVAHMNSVHMDLRRTADAAALAGVSQLALSITDGQQGNGGGDQVLAEAQLIAGLNMPDEGVVLADADVIRGNWNPETRSFTASGTPENAVQVTTRRAQANANPISMYFATFLGYTQSDLTATAVAFAPPPQGVDVVPVALRAPGFGPVDPDIEASNSGKSGPSEPLDGEKFQIGEEVALFIFGKGKQSPVHLVLDIPESEDDSEVDSDDDSEVDSEDDSEVDSEDDSDDDSEVDSEDDSEVDSDDDSEVDSEDDSEDDSEVESGNDSEGVSDVDKILSGEKDGEDVSIGDHVSVIGEGSGHGGFGGKLEDRLNDGDPDNDTIIVPVVDILPGSRDADGKLSGDVEVVDFVAVTLTEVREVEVVEVDAEGNETTITIRVLYGEVTRRTAGTGDGSSTTGGEYSDNSVLSLPLLVQ